MGANVADLKSIKILSAQILRFVAHSLLLFLGLCKLSTVFTRTIPFSNDRRLQLYLQYGSNTSSN